MDLTVCDGLFGPPQTDVSNMGFYWGSGVLTNWWLELLSPTKARWHWQDAAWAEYTQLQYLFRHNGVDWVQVADTQFYQGIGIHRENPVTSPPTPPRDLGIELDRALSGLPPGFFVNCGTPWFAAYNAVGTWSCGPITWLN